MAHSTHMRRILYVLTGLFMAAGVPVQAAPDYVYHDPGAGVYGQPPGTTMREPFAPREDELVKAFIKIGPSFTYDAVAVYYTTDGSTPQGSQGIPQAGTSVLLSYGPTPAITFLYNEPPGGHDDWWEAEFPVHTREYGVQVRYKISAWDIGAPVPEVFAGDGAVFEWTNKLAWPGKGSPHADHAVGYPDVHFWKEEGVVGNNYMNVMVDRNGSVYDVYYPSAGCVNGMGTKNEGYIDGLDTFPPGLPPGHRGQMNINIGMVGLRVDGVTYWLTNEAGGDYVDHTQRYVPDTNLIETTQRLVAAGNDILVRQIDHCPKGIDYPLDQGGQPNRGLYIKRLVLTNNGAADKTVNVYFYTDYAINGGDDYDGTFTDAGRGAMVSYDTTRRVLPPGSAEYNPTSGMDYEKNVSVYLAAAMRLSDSIGGSVGAPASDFWSDTSTDEGLGWVGMPVELPVGVSKEVAVLLVGGFDDFAGATGTYDYQMAAAIDWFMSSDLDALESATAEYWTDWLASGVRVDTPDDAYGAVFKRGLLATALHLDGANGGIIAGMHNGAYPFVWPRDAAWAAITLDRTGHPFEADEIYRFLREVTERYQEGSGRTSWWFQKYTTDGHRIWTSPQVDETACFPWGVYYHYQVTGDVGFLDLNYPTVWEAAIASSEDSDHPHLFFDDPYNLMYSNNLWEDQYGDFLYSNAAVERCLRDATSIAIVLDEDVCPGGPGTCNYHNDAALYTERADIIHSGIQARLEWDGENTDISQLGLVYPFAVYGTQAPEIVHVVDRINGVAADFQGAGSIKPLVNTGGEWEGLINRYWGDGYWHNPFGPNPNASPWFLTTMWYGCYYAERQDSTPNGGDIDNHKYRLDRLLDRLGPIGLGAEQIAPSNSLLYDGQMDFVLETAWPNAWESMSFVVDAVMVFLDYTPDARGNTLRIEPKLPSGWPQMTFANLMLGPHRLDVSVSDTPTYAEHAITNVTGLDVDYDTWVRVPVPTTILAVSANDTPVPYDHDASTGRVHVTGGLATGSSSITAVRVYYGERGDGNGDGVIDLADFPLFAACVGGPESAIGPACAVFDFDVDADVDLVDLGAYQAAMERGE